MWSRLKSPDAIEHALLLPILFHCVDASGRPLLDAQRRSLADPVYARDAWRDIPPSLKPLAHCRRAPSRGRALSDQNIADDTIG